jgi:hypothetical protein
MKAAGMLFLLVLASACGSGTDSDTKPTELGAGAGGAAPASTGGTDHAPAPQGGEASTPQESIPDTVNVELLGALIGPGKLDNTQWDGAGTVPPEVLEAIATAAGLPGTGAILGVIQSAAYQALSKPDPLGSAELNEGGGFDSLFTIALTSVASNEEDTFAPSWPQPYPGWKDVPFGNGTQVRVTVLDEDLASNDNIGVATINFDDLKEAWDAQDSHWVRVDDQTNGQLLALQVQVTSTEP